MLHFLMMRLEINIIILLPIDIVEVLARVSGQMSSMVEAVYYWPTFIEWGEGLGLLSYLMALFLAEWLSSKLRQFFPIK